MLSIQKLRATAVLSKREARRQLVLTTTTSASCTIYLQWRRKPVSLRLNLQGLLYCLVGGASLRSRRRPTKLRSEALVCPRRYEAMTPPALHRAGTYLPFQALVC